MALQAYHKRNLSIGILATILTGVLSYMAYSHVPLYVPKLPTLADRLAFTLRWQVVSALPLVAGIYWITSYRLVTGARNPMTGKDADKVEVHVRYVQNTVETFILSAVGQLALSTYLDEAQMKLIPILVLVFVAARVVFWIGYCQPSNERTNRATGFLLTVTPTLVTYGYCIYRLFTSQ